MPLVSDHLIEGKLIGNALMAFIIRKHTSKWIKLFNGNRKLE